METRTLTGLGTSWASEEAVSAFTQRAAVSPGAAYAVFRELLDRLQDATTRVEARRFLERLVQGAKHRPAEPSHFRFRHLELPDLPGGDLGTLTLLELPGIFTPEEWSYTFFEGLVRYPEAAFRDRELIELGCGNGWVTLALAAAVRPRSILGLDINPRAIRCSRLNLFLNGLDAAGKPRLASDGRSLLDRVSFEESDLLEVCRERGQRADFVLGCIPQVLNVDPEETLEAVSEGTSEEALYALSNYYERQGYIEDQFGLGLIARAVEESVEILRPDGAVILNLGGRPGATVLERLFRRRGLSVTRVWQTRVEQAGDTDIAPLVEVERRSRHRFEFFMGPSVETSVSARTAQRYLEAGGTIYHRLAVVEARMEFPAEIQRIFQRLRQPGYEEVRSSLDLDFPDREVAAEKVSFLARLAELLHQATCFPYEETEGRAALRRCLADYLRLYFRMPTHPEELVVVPSRVEALVSLLETFRPRLALIDSELVRALTAGEGELAVAGEVIEAPRSAELVVDLVRSLRPECVVTCLADHEARSSESFIRLLEVTREVGALLVVDLSEQFELSSEPSVHGVLRYLSSHPLPAHAALLCGLVKNRVYEDLQLGFLYSQNPGLIRVLTDAGELTYSRTPWLSQVYYESLLDDLLRFQLPERRRLRAGEELNRAAATPEASGLPGLQARALEAFQHPAVAANYLPFDADTVRMDYGENSLASPTRVKEALLEAFARHQVSEEEADPTAEIRSWAQLSLGTTADYWIFGHGVAPLFAGIARGAAEFGETMLFPTGAYGHFVATCQLLGVEAKIISSERRDQFKWTPAGLEDALAGASPGAWVFLNAPIANPTGALYSPREVADLLEVTRRANGRLVVDAIFAGLAHSAEDVARLNLDGPDWVLLGGLSKLFAAGGLRFGFAGTEDPVIAQRLRRLGGGTPHWTLRHAAKGLYRDLVRLSEPLRQDLATQRRVLAERSTILSNQLSRWGWTVAPAQGGLFLVACPTDYLTKNGDPLQKTRSTQWIDGNEVAESLFHQTGLLINGPTWTGIPEHCRFVLSVSDRDFSLALQRIEDFGRSCGIEPH
ncbi:MAG: aminotransferase class I/II-fold pyridoxal phosphate-dependent enzyme [Thermoanaerobaculia bacterium]|nr:aminotransferase class I/II-fold pyridoxal phosphate-dependent enzyme [Thermoanaerobaculia bacterium]